MKRFEPVKKFTPYLPLPFPPSLTAKVMRCAKEIRHEIEAMGALVLAGGVHWNTYLNTAMRREFGVPVHVAPNPSDGGVPLGNLWSLQAHSGHPIQTLRLNPYVGLPLQDLPGLPRLAARYRARPCAVECLAALLAGGGLVGVMRGRLAFSHWNLGDRAILADPRGPHVRGAINRLRDTNPWQSLCAMVPLESRAMLSPDPVASPYRSFSVALHPQALRALPALNRTAQLHTVQKAANPWLHQLLRQVAARTGWPVLINSDLSRPMGQTVYNSAREALVGMLCTNRLSAWSTEDSSLGPYMWIEGHLFSKKEATSYHRGRIYRVIFPFCAHMFYFR